MARAKRPKPIPGPEAIPITKIEVRDALRRSGYPLELRLLETFTSMGVNTQFGSRVLLLGKDQRSREIDLIGSMLGDVKYEASDDRSPKTAKMCTLILNLYVEAKSFEPAAGFVGFPAELAEWDNPRDVCGGAPCIGVADHSMGSLFELTGDESSWTAYDPIRTGVPICVQWAIVRQPRSGHGGDKRHVAIHDDPFWESMDTLVRACEARMYHTSLDRRPQVHVMYYAYPMIVISTPRLYLYDVKKKSLKTTDRLLLAREFDVGDGRHVTRFVDVAIEKAVPKALQLYDYVRQRILKTLMANPSMVEGEANRQKTILEANRAAQPRRF